MTAASPARILVVTPALIQRLATDELTDLINYHSPDAAYLVETDDQPVTDTDIETLRELITGPCICPARHNRLRHLAINDIDFLVVPDSNLLDQAAEFDATDRFHETETTYLCTPVLNVTVDTTQLDAHLDPAAPFRAHHEHVTTPHIYVSDRLDAEYQYTWDETLRVQGARPTQGERGCEIPCLVCHPDHRVGVETVSETRLGLRALTGVGKKTAARLSEHGYTDRAALAEATRSALQDIPGIGQRTANLIYDHARALERGEVVRTSELPVPGTNPVFLDIETDGFAPSIIWQIGVYNTAADSYRSFLERDPDRKAGILQAFLSWYLTEAEGQRLITWNGWQFDFTHLRAFITEYTPEYTNVWEQIPKTDLYHWAVKNENAILPGRTNQLDDISTALGYDPYTTGLTARMVATDYRNWATTADASAASAPGDAQSEYEWGRYRAYCEADVRALACVYDHLALEDSEKAATNAYPSINP